MTVRDLINGSLRVLGVLASGEQATATEAGDALASLNSLIDSWRNERLMVYGITPNAFSLVAGKLSYTLGPGGDFNMPRPVRVDKVQLTYTQTGGQPINLPIVMLDLDQYQQFSVPTTQGTIPLWVFIDDAFPLRNVYFYTVPNLVNTVEIFTWQQLASFTDVNATLSLPPGYERALRYGLAVELADEYGKTLPQTVAAKAMDAKALVKSVNSQSPLMQVDASIISNRAGFNYMTGE